MTNQFFVNRLMDDKRNEVADSKAKQEDFWAEKESEVVEESEKDE